MKIKSKICINIEIEQGEIIDEAEIKIELDAEYRMEHARISYNQRKAYKRRLAILNTTKNSIKSIFIKQATFLEQISEGMHNEAVEIMNRQGNEYTWFNVNNIKAVNESMRNKEITCNIANLNFIRQCLIKDQEMLIQDNENCSNKDKIQNNQSILFSTNLLRRN